MIHLIGGGSLRGSGRANDELENPESRNEPYHPPQVREERWSPQEPRLGPPVIGTYTDGRHGGALRTGELDKEVSGQDDRRWMHIRVEWSTQILIALTQSDG